MFRIVSLLFLSVLLSACEQGPSPEEMMRISQTLVPDDPQLNEIYQRSCKNCHTLTSTGAPLTGDISVWQSRLDKGRDTLLENVVNGFGGMPPFGLCMDCNAEQLNALIDFMAQNPQQ